ncbi:MAG: hypothetical protein ABR956_00165 [Terracidiphilus sp.]
MRAFQTQFRGIGRAKQGALPVVTLLCLFLLALLAVVQVAHMHPTESDADHCPLCIVMHTAAPVAVAAAVVVLVQIEQAAPIFEARAVIRHWNPKLFTRPPPVDC